MAEALAAFGIAVNIMQFIDFSSRVLSTSYKLYKSSRGVSEEHQALEDITNDLRNISSGLQHAVRQEEQHRSASSDDLQLQKLGAKCSLACDELLSALEHLKALDRPSKWANLRAALRSVWKESRIDGFRARVNEFRQEVIVRVLNGLRWVLRTLPESLIF